LITKHQILVILESYWHNTIIRQWLYLQDVVELIMAVDDDESEIGFCRWFGGSIR